MLPFLSHLSLEQLYKVRLHLLDENDSDIPNGGTLEFVVRDRENSEQYLIFRYEGNLYRLDGYYDSMSGGEFENLREAYEVVERDITVTVYERKG